MILPLSQSKVKTAPLQAKAQAFAGLSEMSPTFPVSSFQQVKSAPGRIAATTEQAHPSGSYGLKKFDSSITFQYNNLFKDIKKLQDQNLHSKKSIEKRLLRERITGVWGSGSDAGASYLEYNAHTGGDLQAPEIIDLKYAENVIGQCGRSAVWMFGASSGADYVKRVSCRKQWCPDCGGKGKIIHKARLHSVLKRVNPEKHNIQQLVLPPPAHLRSIFQDRQKIEEVEQKLNLMVRKQFGKPVFDSKGHVKKHQLKDGAISTFHVFGEKPGEFKPHWNIQIIVPKNRTLKLSKEKIASIKNDFLKIMQGYDETLDKINIHYSFRDTAAKVMHSIKYMIRPWSAVDYNAIEDESLKRFLVLEMSGFRYLRFWGALSNTRYQDEMDLQQIIKESESKAGEKLIFKFIAPFDLKAWLPRLEQIDDGLYRVKQKIKGG